MRKLVIVLALVALVLTGAVAQTGPFIDDFQTAFFDFAGAMASSLAVNSTIGSSWSDAYVGGFPHLGVGVSFGMVYGGKDSVGKMYEVLGISVPADFSGVGIPFPAMAANAKIGFPFLPLDIGVKVGMMPGSMSDSIKQSSGVGVTYKNFGAQARWALAKESFLIPDISIGLGFNFQSGSVSAPTDIPSQQMEYWDGDGNQWDVTLTKPNLLLSWKSTTIDASIQMSKTLLWILTPYIGAGLTMGTSTVKGGLDSDIFVFQSGYSTNPNNPFNVAGPESQQRQNLINAYQAATGSTLSLSDTGFLLSVDKKDPVLRIYGGVSLNLILIVDIQAIVIPKTGDVGASVMARLQL